MVTVPNFIKASPGKDRLWEWFGLSRDEARARIQETPTYLADGESFHIFEKDIASNPHIGLVFRRGYCGPLSSLGDLRPSDTVLFFRQRQDARAAIQALKHRLTYM